MRQEFGDNLSLGEEMRVALAASISAGAILMGFLDRVKSEQKADGEMVSEADRAADSHLRSALSTAFPRDGLLSEETPDDGDRFHRERVWIIDPLDGTREYLTGIDEWAIHVGLVEKGEPILGIVHRPSRGETWVGIPGVGAWVRRELKGSFTPLVARPRNGLIRVILSHRDLGQVGNAWLARLPVHEQVRCGGSGLKAVLVAEGAAHVYGALTPKMKEWDTCAPHAVVVGAGGLCTDLALRPLRYNRKNLFADQGFLVVSPGEVAELRDALASAATQVPWLEG